MIQAVKDFQQSPNVDQNTVHPLEQDTAVAYPQNDNGAITARNNRNRGVELTVSVNLRNNTSSNADTSQSKTSFTLKEWWFQRMITNKLFHVLSVCVLAVQALALLKYPFLMPYYFTVASPVLIAARFYMYFKEKQLLFMIDFCYFANAYAFIVIWALPASKDAFVVLFALSNGPISWAVIFFHNSMVFHDIDKVTSCFIHTLPSYICFCIRWWPVVTSRYWYIDFVNIDMNTTVTVVPAVVDHLVIPLGCYALHLLCLLVIVHGLVRPPDEYVDSYRYLILSQKDGFISKFVNFFGEKYRYVMYFAGNVLLSTATISFSLLLFHYIYVHVAFLIVCFLLIHWNGATYYMDIFGKRRFLPNNFFGPLARRSFNSRMTLDRDVTSTPNTLNEEQHVSVANGHLRESEVK